MDEQTPNPTTRMDTPEPAGVGVRPPPPPAPPPATTGCPTAASGLGRTTAAGTAK